MVEALDQLVVASRISLVYDPQVIGSARVFCQFERESPETVLRCITREAGLDFYRLSSGTYVVIASVTEAPQFAAFAGIVLDAATGQPLPAARVRLEQAQVARPANDVGAFAFPPVLPGEYEVRVQAVGYRPWRATLRLMPGRAARWRVPMERLPVALDVVAVTGLVVPPRSDAAAAQAVSTDSAVALLAPGALFRAAANQLGVGQRALAGDLHIQGGEAGEHQFRIDGVPVFDPLSLARLFGSFTPLAVQRLTVRKAGFGVTHGSFTAGVIDLEHSLGDETGTGTGSGTAVLDPYSVSGRVSGAATLGGRRVRGMLAGRRSLWDVTPISAVRDAVHDWSRVDRPLLERAVGQLPALAPDATFATDAARTSLRFSDVHGAARAELGPFQSLAASFYVSENDAGTITAANAPATAGGSLRLATREQYTWSTLGGQLRHEWFPTARLQQSVQVRYSHHVLHHRHEASLLDGDGAAPVSGTPAGEATGGEAPHEGNSVNEVALEGTLRYLLRDGTTLTVGAEGARTGSTMEMDNRVFRPMQARNSAWRATQYSELQQRLGASVRLDAGLRLTWVPTFATVYGEPRISLTGDHTRGGGALSWRLAGGVHRQFVTQFDLPAIGPTAVVSGSRFWLPVDGTVRPPESYHLAAEAVRQWQGGWELRAEAYAKWLTAIPAINYPVLLGEGTVEPMPYNVTQEMFITQGRGRTVGGGVRVARRTAHWRSELGYDAGWSERTFPVVSVTPSSPRRGTSRTG